MADAGARAITINCNVILLSGDEGLPSPCCTVCRETLDLHQPDMERPDRFLATCGNCGAWHLLEQPEEGNLALLARLPELPELLQANKAAPVRRPRAQSG